jgi:hypothetical protein
MGQQPPLFSPAHSISPFSRTTKQYFVDAVFMTPAICRKYRGQQASIVSVNAGSGDFRELLVLTY